MEDGGVSKPLWTAEQKVPVSVSKKLLPTFLNLLSEQQYALVLRVSIPELRNWKRQEVVIPLQLIYHDREKPMDDDFLFAGLDNSDWYETLLHSLDFTNI